MSSSPAISQYPIIAEIWSVLEATLQGQAKRLVEDIAKHQKADPKAIWAKVRPQIRVGLLDVELPDNLVTVCSHPSGTYDGSAVRCLCRAPCIIGFDSCARHVGTPVTSPSTTHENVDRVIDYMNNTYFVDNKNIAHDRTGKSRGVVREDVLYLFEARS